MYSEFVKLAFGNILYTMQVHVQFLMILCTSNITIVMKVLISDNWKCQYCKLFLDYVCYMYLELQYLFHSTEYHTLFMSLNGSEVLMRAPEAT